MKRRGVRVALVLLVLAAALAVWIWPLGGRRALRRWWRPEAPPNARFLDPEGLAIDAEGRIWVACEDSWTLWILHPDGSTLLAVGELEGLPGKVTSGDSLAVAGPGRIVAINGFHSLTELRIEGGRLKAGRTFSRRGHGEGEFEDPEGIAVDAATGEIYATDEDHRRVLVFSSDGAYLRKLDVPHDPEGVGVFEDRVYVTFSKDGYVACYGKDGVLRFEFARGVVEEPDFVIVGPDRLLYVTDQRGGKIEVFDLDGKPVRRIGRPGSGPGEFRDPEDLAFDLTGHLVVADGGNFRIQVLTREGAFVREHR